MGERRQPAAEDESDVWDAIDDWAEDDSFSVWPIELRPALWNMGARFIGTLIISGLLAAGFGCGGSDTIQGVKMNVDRDVDGLTDAEEAHHGTNPDHPDTDGDGLSDGAEVETHGTSPTDSDVDHDGASDGAEINEHHTDPHAADSDGDGLNDGDEAAMHHTDPIHADSDGDGIDDGHEIAEGSDPHVANTDHEAHDYCASHHCLCEYHPHAQDCVSFCEAHACSCTDHPDDPHCVAETDPCHTDPHGC